MATSYSSPSPASSRMAGVVEGEARASVSTTAHGSCRPALVGRQEDRPSRRLARILPGRRRDPARHGLGQGRSLPYYETLKGPTTSDTRSQTNGVGGTSMRVGTDGRARIAYAGNEGIRYARFTGSGFSTRRVPGTTVWDRHPVLTLDAGDKSHIVWTRNEPATCGESPVGTWYASNASGSWKSQRITKDTSATPASKSTARAGASASSWAARGSGTTGRCPTDRGRARRWPRRGGRPRPGCRATRRPGRSWWSTSMGPDQRRSRRSRRNEARGKFRAAVHSEDHGNDPLQSNTDQRPSLRGPNARVQPGSVVAFSSGAIPIGSGAVADRLRGVADRLGGLDRAPSNRADRLRRDRDRLQVGHDQDRCGVRSRCLGRDRHRRRSSRSSGRTASPRRTGGRPPSMGRRAKRSPRRDGDRRPGGRQLSEVGRVLRVSGARRAVHPRNRSTVGPGAAVRPPAG